jgi:hypothetical protein
MAKCDPERPGKNRGPYVPRTPEEESFQLIAFDYGDKKYTPLEMTRALFNNPITSGDVILQICTYVAQIFYIPISCQLLKVPDEVNFLNEGAIQCVTAEQMLEKLFRVRTIAILPNRDH